MLSAAGEGALVLPPLFEAVFIADPSDVHAHACRIAAQSGAGTLVYAMSEETVALAIVLEPDKPLVAARLAFFACMAAFPLRARTAGRFRLARRIPVRPCPLGRSAARRA
jgi:hypothetical protein